MDNRKQYYNNLNPGEKSIESRLGAKILMNEDLTINAAIRPEYLEQLRKEGFQGNVSPSFDDNTSIVYMGNKSVTLDQQGNITQLSLGIQQSENVIVAGDYTPPDEDFPPTIIDFNPKKGTTGDKVTITGDSFIKVRAVLINEVSCLITSKTTNKLEITIPEIPGVTSEQKYKIVIVTADSTIESKDDFTFFPPPPVQDDILETNYDEEIDKFSNYEVPESIEEKNVVIEKTDAPKTDGPCLTLNINTNITDATTALAKNSSGKPTAYFNVLCAAKASIGTYTKSIPGTQNGNLGCAAAISIIYLRAFGHGLEKNNLGTNIRLILGTYSLYSALKANTTNFKTTEVFRNPGDWTPSIVQLFQPGDIILTRTECSGCKNGHVGYVSDDRAANGSYKIINNSSRRGKIDNGDNTYNVQTWSKIAKKSGVGPTFLIRFIGTIGTTISKP